MSSSPLHVGPDDLGVARHRLDGDDGIDSGRGSTEGHLVQAEGGADVDDERTGSHVAFERGHDLVVVAAREDRTPRLRRGHGQDQLVASTEANLPGRVNEPAEAAVGLLRDAAPAADGEAPEGSSEAERGAGEHPRCAGRAGPAHEARPFFLRRAGGESTSR